MDEDEEITPEEKRDPSPWSWTYFWSVMVSGASGYFRLLGAILTDIEHAMDEHVEYKRTRKEFYARAGLEIEALTREPAPASKAS